MLYWIDLHNLFQFRSRPSIFEILDYKRLLHVTPENCRAEETGDLTAKHVTFLLPGYGKLYLYSLHKEQIPVESIKNTFSNLYIICTNGSSWFLCVLCIPVLA